ncbi:hypothetical protein HO133_002494 [Letharia lupina]|uniref:Assembly chaperone of rpl4 n=1 Tax=Letharia lupina TaxID=560253 RepID=A0A8H6CCA4_9LECA|nr:uncharacterized protein HO133_002494 [Letharia lupina]KAF6220814.1 hypothetical protein HO133_002494 [Letharia lupina]
MLAEAESLLREGRGRAEDALPVALRALRRAAGRDDAATTTLPALGLVAEIYLELGDATAAREYFLQAVSLDPEGRVPETLGGGAEKFLWLAQLSEEGGQDSVEWFERGAAVLRREIGALGEGEGEGGEEKRKKLAGALCGMVEVYMTDLSWEPSAEAKCESLISEALLVAPRCAEPLQTLASVRISQTRIPEARKALGDSMGIWRDLEPEDAAVPDFPTRISLARLLMEVEMEEEALGVVERLVQEDDGSVEAWYLGGWCLYLLGMKQRKKHDERNGAAEGDAMEDANGCDEDEEDLLTQTMVSSREWLRQSLKLYELVEYEDERLKDHAMELVEELDAIIGERGEDEVDEGEEEWNGFGEESEKEQEDEEMDEG